MRFKVNKLSDVQAEVTITNSAQEVEQAYQNAYTKARKDFSLPGFRKNKVPLELVERHLGDAVVKDAVHDLLISNMQECVEDLKPQPVSLPEMKVKSFERGKGANFVGIYDTYPVVKLGPYRKLKAIEDKPLIDEKDLKRELERVQDENARMYPKEGGAEMKDHTSIHVLIKHEKQKILEKKDLAVVLGDNQVLPNFDQHLLGMKTDEKKEFSLPVPEDFPDQRIAGKELSVHVTLVDCRYKELPKLDDEFARDLGEYETLEQFKQKLHSSMNEKLVGIIRSRTKQSLLEQLAEQSEVSLPESFVTQEMSSRIDRMIETIQKRSPNKKKNISRDDLARLMDQEPDQFKEKVCKDSRSALTYHFLMKELAKVLDLQASKADMEKQIEQNYGVNMPMDQLEKVDTEGKLRIELEDSVLKEKAIDWLYEHAKISPGKKISLDELFAAQEEAKRQ